MSAAPSSVGRLTCSPKPPPLPNHSADADLTLLSRPAPPPGAWQGKVVWIVGASQGLGEALARHWAAGGARLILSSRSVDKLQARCCWKGVLATLISPARLCMACAKPPVSGARLPALATDPSDPMPSLLAPHACRR